THRADARMISATNANLTELVEKGVFRQDLLFRLNTIEIALPALRDRPEDISHLASFFLKERAARYRKNVSGFESSSTQALMEHGWPGNVRELDHVIERAVLMSSSKSVTAFDLALQSTPDARLSARL